MKTPNVIVPIGFDVEADLEMQGEHIGVCSCPACKLYYPVTGLVIRCECGFEFPTNAHENFSRGRNDGIVVADGAMLTAGMRMQMACPYYRTGFEKAADLDSFDGFDSVDWGSIVEIPAYINFRSMDLCERCGSKKDDNLVGLCVTCKSRTTCKHRTSMMEERCKAGVELDQFRGDAPCYFCNGGEKASCDKFEPVGIQSILDGNKAFATSVAKFMLAGPVIAKVKEEKKGKDWVGEVECPVCGGRLHMSHAAYNGHVWGGCETKDCLEWLE